MPVYDKLLSIFKERGITVKQVERECGLANATIRRWKTQNPSLDSVRKVAEYLNLSIDFIVYGSSLNNNDEFTDDESDLIEMYRALDDRDKNDAFEILKLKYERSLNKKGFTYSHQESDTDSGDNTANGIA